MFNNKIQDFNEKSCDKQNTTKLNKSWHVQFSKPKGSGVEKECFLKVFFMRHSKLP